MFLLSGCCKISGQGELNWNNGPSNWVKQLLLLIGAFGNVKTRQHCAFGGLDQYERCIFSTLWTTESTSQCLVSIVNVILVDLWIDVVVYLLSVPPVSPSIKRLSDYQDSVNPYQYQSHTRQQTPPPSATAGLFSSLRGGAASLLKNVKDASTKVMDTVSA